MAPVKKLPVGAESSDWGPWTATRFDSDDARDAFLRSIDDAREGGWDAEAMDDDDLGAWVRWRPGRFLKLNDLAYGLGGRIVVSVVKHRNA